MHNNFNYKSMETKINCQPLGDQLVVNVPIVSEKTKSGIIKSESMMAEEKSGVDSFLEVVAIGSAVKEVKVGDKVMVDGMMKTLEVDGVQYGQIREYNVMGIRK